MIISTVHADMEEKGGNVRRRMIIMFLSLLILEDSLRWGPKTAVPDVEPISNSDFRLCSEADGFGQFGFVQVCCSRVNFSV